MKTYRNNPPGRLATRNLDPLALVVATGRAGCHSPSSPPVPGYLVRTEAPPKHWAAAEIAVIVDEAKQRLAYFEKTPFWGAAYYRGFRAQIERYLGGFWTGL